MTPRRSVLMVSKPVAPPWNDSSKNLVKDLAVAGERFDYRVMTPTGYRLPADGVTSEPVYPAGNGAHTPALAQNLRALARLLRRDETALTNFFFAPNPRASFAARLALKARPRRTVQTVCSCPASFHRADRLLFADRVVVLSNHTRLRFERAGIASARLAVIPPGIQIPEPPSRDRRAATRARHRIAADQSLVIYPGDYQFSRAAETVTRAIIALGPRQAKTTFILACRIKQQASRTIEEQLRRELGAAGLLGQVRFYHQVPDILDLLGACDLCLLPAESLYAKMDLPLVLIEAMALGVPLVVADQPPLSEILVGDVGLAVPARDPQALARVVGDLLDNPVHRAKLADAGPRVARAHFDISRVARQYEALYQEVLR